MTDQEKFQAAYKAWRDGRTAYDARMLAEFAGEATIDGAQLIAECDELARLLAAFTESSKPFLRWR